MGSQRFPGKTMYPLQGKPSIAHLLDAVLQVFAAQDVVVATSVNRENDELVAFCEQSGIEAYRGDEENVASRFRDILRQTEAGYFVRLNADSPLLDYRTITEVLGLLQETEAEIVSTAVRRTYPSGMNVEGLKSSVFLSEYPQFVLPGHFEHVTKYFYDNAERFDIRAVESGIERPERYKFSFDTQEDRDRMEQLFAALEQPHYEYTLQEKCALYDRLFPVEAAC
jgi:spore coat polysaccharide biosynthesis protein SpsF